MPTVWFSFRRTINCGSDPSDVHSPRTMKHLSSIMTTATKKSPAIRSGCSRSISNLRDVMATIHGSKRHVSIDENLPSNYSPRSIGSGEFIVNPSSVAHDHLVLTSSNSGKLFDRRNANDHVVKGGGGRALLAERDSLGKKRASSKAEVGQGLNGGNNTSCLRCEGMFAKSEDLESHHLHLHSHAVSELTEGDSSRKIVEIICRSSSSHRGSNPAIKIEKILKIHNTQRTLARFEDHREAVKNKANRLPKKHPRCIADGNELLRFHGTNLACNLGVDGTFGLCTSGKCGVCRVIRRGFEINGGIGVFTASTGERALGNLCNNDGSSMTRRALLVCRVIAGRVHRPTEGVRSVGEFTGFDSLAGKVGIYSNIEELYLFDSIALLPCFVIICKD